jgi:DNA-binding transcriptional regulator YiaG
MNDSPLKVTLDEITPDKILEVENYLLSERFVDLVRSNLVELGNYRQMIKAHLDGIEASCKIRAMRACDAGVPIKEVAETLGLSQATIKKWITVY